MRGKRMLTALCLIGVILLCVIRTEATGIKGSIEINITKAGDPVPGGRTSLYCAALWDGEQYRKTEAFQEFEISEADWQVNRVQMAELLSEYAQKHKVAGLEKTISPEGSVYYSDLEEGIYLAVQTEAHEGYLPFCPFLVEIPTCIDGRSSYEIVAYPKVTKIPDGESAQTGDGGSPVVLVAASGWAILWILSRIWKQKKRIE